MRFSALFRTKLEYRNFGEPCLYSTSEQLRERGHDSDLAGNSAQKPTQPYFRSFGRSDLQTR
jgi:hypothetical protein